MLWKQSFTLEGMNQISKNTLAENLGIEFVDFGEDFIVARMPVDQRTKQPMGLLHGGASVALAETLGSVASVLCIEDTNKSMAVGVEINANHLRPATDGFVFGTVKAIRVGRNMHVWSIEIKDEAEKLICVSRITIAIVPRF
ncbi:MAG: hotdog fold thioesterase [Saprospiraceae bacterium]|nr:hotdog fold thioesterase [Saprospiraceae bacterium]